MKRGRKVLLWVMGLLLLLILIAIPTAYFVMKSQWFRDAIHQRVIAEVEKATGGKTEFEHLTFDWKTQVATVSGFTLHGTEAADVPALFKADLIEIGLRFDSGMRTSIRLASLVVRKPRIRIEVRPDGTNNLPKPAVARKNTKSLLEEVVDLAVRRVEVEQGIVDYADRRLPFSAHGDNVELRFSYEVPSKKYLGTFSSRKLRLTAPDFPKMLFNTDVSLSVDKDGADIRSLIVDTGQTTAVASGRVTNLESLTTKLKVSAHVDTGEMWPPAIPGTSSGKVHFDGTFAATDWKKYRLVGSVSGAGLSYRYNQYQANQATLQGQLDLNHEGMSVENLQVSAAEGQFAGKAKFATWHSLALEGEVKGVEVQPLLAKQSQLKAKMTDIPWNGIIAGPLTLDCQLGPSTVCNGAVQATVSPAPGQPPITGFVGVDFNQRANELKFSNSFLATEASRVEFGGELNRNARAHAVTTNFEDLKPVMKLLGLSGPLPVQLEDGKAEFEGTIDGDLANPRINGVLNLTSFIYDHSNYDKLHTTVAVSNSDLKLTGLELEQGSLKASGNIAMSLTDWKATRAAPITASGQFANVPIGRFLPDVSKTGTASGTVQINGSMDNPRVAGKVEAIGLNVNGQAVERLVGSVDLRDGKLRVLESAVSVGALRMEAKGEFTPKGPISEPASWKTGAGVVDLVYPPALLSQWKQFRDLKLPLDGRLGWKGSTGFQLVNNTLQLESLNGQAVLDQFVFDGVDVGTLTANTVTRGNQLTFSGAGKLRGSDVKIDGQSQLKGDYPTQWTVKLAALPLGNLQEFFKGSRSPFWQIDGAIAGEAQITGPAFDPDKWKGQIQIPAFEIKPSRKQISAKIPELVFRSKGPITMGIDGKILRLEQAKFEGKNTELEASGAFSLASKNPWDVKIKGSLELGLARTFNPDVIAAGMAVVDASVRGSLENPQVYGKLELKNASLFFEGLPTGLDKVNGALLFDNKRATIENKLQAQAGGGDLTLAGFIEDAGKEIYYRLQVTANRVRLRYPEGVSTVADANLTLTGSSSVSLLAGKIEILRSGFTPKSDLGSILAQASKATTPAPSAQSDLLKGMQFDVRILTAANATLESSLTSELQADADLRLRGSALRPSLLGRIQVNQGDINFFGNKYVIQHGEIGFYNSAKIEPTVNMDLETRVRGVTVTVSFTGPINKLNISYRSDPPRQSQEIIGLLTVGRDPDTASSVASAQTTQNDLVQNSANSLLGQALAAPVSGRLERLFGVSRLKIDPQLSSLEGTPQARVTIEQQISRDVTMTFVTNLARTQQQIVRMEWDLNKQWSMVVVRDENGSFGMDFQFKKRFK